MKRSYQDSMSNTTSTSAKLTPSAFLAKYANVSLGGKSSTHNKPPQHSASSLNNNNKIIVAKPNNTIHLDQLSTEQKGIVNRIIQGRESIFFTGSAGSGKSFLLRYLISILPKSTTYVTASTGIAAVAIEGCTIHRFAGIQLGDDPVQHYIEMIQEQVPTNYLTAHYRWLKCKVLIIDEISMINGYLFDKLNTIAQAIRKNSLPFGGIQLVLSGDLLQLPPVRSDKYIFDADCWSTCITHCCMLTQVFRQSDTFFVKLLNEVRFGICTEETEAVLKSCAKTELKEVNGVLPTLIYTTNNAVRTYNYQQLQLLKPPEVKFTAQDWAEDRAYLAMMQKDCAALPELFLRVGAQVMLLKNLDTSEGLCNGSRGVVVAFERVYITEHPLSGEIVMRAKSSSSSSVTETEPVQPQPPGGAIYTAPESNNALAPPELKPRYMPRVKFENGVELVVPEHRFELKLHGKLIASRLQIPLNLSWAITAHKSQGCSLNAARIDASSTFEQGQIYVALSRVRSLQGLQLLNFKTAHVMANPRIVEFYRKMHKQC